MRIGETFITGIASRRFTTNDAVRVQNEHSNIQLSTKTLMMPFREDLTDAVLDSHLVSYASRIDVRPPAEMC